MCLIVFAWRPGQPLPLVLAANRDEFYQRPSAPLGEWPDVPGLYAGRDLQAGGTWLGVGSNGRFAAVTNIRDPRQTLGPRSRGELPVEFLRGSLAPAAYLQAVAQRRSEYSGFNLLVGDDRQLWYLNAREGQARRLEEGLYGLSNDALDTPWPKVVKARAGLAERLAHPGLHSLLEPLADAGQACDDELPDTGVGLELERLLSSPFIRSASYGTRASTALVVHADGTRQLLERSFGPEGVVLGEIELRLPD
jgi:uncharacterized protein with NRDE domain